MLLDLPLPYDLKFQKQLQEALGILSKKEAEQGIHRQKRGIAIAKESGLLTKTKVTPMIMKKVENMKAEKRKWELKLHNKLAILLRQYIGF